MIMISQNYNEIIKNLIINKISKATINFVFYCLLYKIVNITLINTSLFL